MALYPLPSNNLQAPTPQIGTKESITGKTLRTLFEANYLGVRKISTSNREKFILVYKTITDAEYAILEEFFFNNLGTPVTFVHPISGIEYEVLFTKGTLDRQYSTYNLSSTEIELITI